MKVCWNITGQCNKNCKFCFREKRYNDLDLDKCLIILDNIVKLEISKINFAGGEPLLYDNLPLLLSESKKRGIYNKLSTNAMLLNEKNIKDILKNVDMLAISVDSSSDEENYFLGRGANHYAHVKKIIPLIKKTFPNIKIEINTIITSQTINGLHELYNSIIKEFKNDEIYMWKLIRFCPFRDMEVSVINKFEISDAEFQKIEREFSSLKSNILINILNIDDMASKNIINPNGVLEINMDKQTKYVDLKNKNLSLKDNYLRKYSNGDYIQNINLNLFKNKSNNKYIYLFIDFFL